MTQIDLEFLEKLAGGAGDINAARYAALPILDALDDTRWLAAFGTVGALGRVHYFLTVTGFGNLGHG